MITWLQKCIFLFHFVITFCQVSENIHTHHKEFHLSQEGGVSYQSKFIRQRGVAAMGGGGDWIFSGATHFKFWKKCFVQPQYTK